MTLKNKNFYHNFCKKNKFIKYIFVSLFFTITPAIGCLNPIKTSAKTDLKILDNFKLDNIKIENNKITNIPKKIENKDDEEQIINSLEKQHKNESNEKEKILRNIKEKKDFYIKILNNNKEEEISFLEYIRGCTASEIGVNAPKEALLAQAIMCATYAIKRRGLNGIFTIGNSFQTYIPKDERIKRFGEEKEKYLENLITFDSLKILFYGNEICECLYDTCVGGYTRPNEDVFHNGDKKYHLDYFPIIKSPELDFYNKINSIDEKRKNKFFLDEVKITPEEKGYIESNIKKVKRTIEININDAYNIVKKHHPNATINPDPTKTIENISYDNYGYVKIFKIFDIALSGEFCRRNFNLPSANFKATIKDDKIIFECLGQGHGVGASQVGASILAAIEKKNYTEILQHYFADEQNKNKINLKSLKDIDPKLLFKN